MSTPDDRQNAASRRHDVEADRMAEIPLGASPLVSHLDRQTKSLRAITVSGRSALAKAREPEEREYLRDRMHELLAELEQEVTRNGADEGILAAIERARRSVYED